MHGRLQGALRAGSVALLVGLLCAAALAAPALSTAQTFGHTHADGTPHHLHPVGLVLGGTPAPAPVAGLEPVQRDGPVPRPVSVSYACTDTPQPRSRAPPS